MKLHEEWFVVKDVFVLPWQSLQRKQIICICADICTFSDLHEQTSAPFDKVSIWSKERAERTVPSLGGHCKQANSATFCSPLWRNIRFSKSWSSYLLIFFVFFFVAKKGAFWREKASVMWWLRAFVGTWALSHLCAFLVWFWCRLLCRHWGFCADIVQISAQKNARWKLCSEVLVRKLKHLLVAVLSEPQPR